MGLTDAPQILFAKVMHKRIAPKVNAFTYGIYYIATPLSKVNAMDHGWRFGIARPALMSFYNRDHGARTPTDLRIWIGNILRDHNVTEADGEIVLVTMPRVLGYVFNPVSFWLCHDRAGHVRAVLCEVNNTFGETHSYLCTHPDHRPITNDDWMTGDKVFHVSPFRQRKGHYAFRFAIGKNAFGAWIDHHDADGKSLLTSLTGRFEPMSVKTLRRAFWQTPLVTLKAIALIHWQAVKLVAKGIKYVPKPAQHAARLTRMRNNDVNGQR